MNPSRPLAERRVRCHAAIVDGKLFRNVIVTESPTDGITVTPFIHETHSTTDFNGVAVISGNNVEYVPLERYLSESFSV